ncbi:MAG: serine hydroxymethyltransferase [Planctomycetes bacterium]|nr:serine hydroxymethyltransferase [Planctomycetota bacterium]
MKILRTADPELAALLRKETLRQAAKLELVPWANYAPAAVLEALGSAAGNKAAEGAPGRRLESGCEHADAIERLAAERARRLFAAEYAGVQPHSGSAAVAAAYQALLKPGDTVLAPAGAAAAHGGPHSLAARSFFFVTYGVDPTTETFDPTALLALARKHRPRLIVAGAAAWPRRTDWAAFRAIADDVKAALLADIAPIAGLIAAQLLPGPAAVADVTVAATHQTLRGPRGGLLLARAAYAERLDRALAPGLQGAPLLNALAAKAAAFRAAAGPEFAAYAAAAVRNAARLAAELAGLGWPLFTGGTDTHLVVLKLSRAGLVAPEAERRLDAAGITAARCLLPGDPGPDRASGLRLGTAAITTRGLGESEIVRIARFVHELLSPGAGAGDAARARIKNEIADWFDAFPIHRDLLA